MYRVSYLTSSVQQLDDFAKQILTLVGTLMTALTAFYFGGRTAGSGAASDISRAAPELTGVEDNAPVKSGTTPPTDSPLTLTLTGTNLNSIRKARLDLAGASPGVGVEAVSVLSNPNRATCQFPAHDAFKKAGVWDATVTDDIGRPFTKAGLLTVKEASATVDPAEPAAAQPVLKSFDPPSAMAAAREFAITGTGLKGATLITLTSDDAGVPAVTATLGTPTDTAIPFTATLGKGRWKARVAFGSANPVDVPGSLTITD